MKAHLTLRCHSTLHCIATYLSSLAAIMRVLATPMNSANQRFTAARERMREGPMRKEKSKEETKWRGVNDAHTTQHTNSSKPMRTA